MKNDLSYQNIPIYTTHDKAALVAEFIVASVVTCAMVPFLPSPWLAALIPPIALVWLKVEANNHSSFVEESKKVGKLSDSENKKVSQILDEIFQDPIFKNEKIRKEDIEVFRSALPISKEANSSSAAIHFYQHNSKCGATLLLDKNSLDTLSKDELKWLIGHEIGHTLNPNPDLLSTNFLLNRLAKTAVNMAFLGLMYDVETNYWNTGSLIPTSLENKLFYAISFSLNLYAGNILSRFERYAETRCDRIGVRLAKSCKGGISFFKNRLDRTKKQSPIRYFIVSGLELAHFPNIESTHPSSRKRARHLRGFKKAYQLN